MERGTGSDPVLAASVTSICGYHPAGRAWANRVVARYRDAFENGEPITAGAASSRMTWRGSGGRGPERRRKEIS